MLVRTFMTQPAICVAPDTACREALRMFRERRIRRAPVTADGKLVGILCERDLLRVLPGSVVELDSDAGYAAERKTVRSAMTARPVTIASDAHLEDAARIMLEHKVGGLPVVDHGLVAGMVTESDLFRALIQAIGAREGIRITVLVPAPGVGGEVPTDVALLCLGLELRITTLLTHETPGGERMLLLCATGARTAELPRALSDAGYSLIEAQ